jgi:hypothetical protein
MCMFRLDPQSIVAACVRFCSRARFQNNCFARKCRRSSAARRNVSAPQSILSVRVHT